MNIPRCSFPRIVIVGGGFAGISLAKKLRNKNVQVVLLDKHNYHNFQPLMYQVATGGLEPDSIAYPIRKVVQEYRDFYFRLAEVKEIDAKNNTIIADIGELKYDYLVLATGSKTNFFGNQEMERNCMAMKTIPQSLNIRSLILENFEQAVLTKNQADRNMLINFVLVGAGPTGVELAGALAEMKKAILPKIWTLIIMAITALFVRSRMIFEIKKPRFDSHFWSVVAESHNLKWLLFAGIVFSIGFFCLIFSSLSETKASAWLRKMQLVSSAAFSLGHGGNDSQKVMGIITVALIANGNISSMKEMPT